MALDADKRRVDALTSNIGHLIGTGLLNRAETAAVARRLTGQDLDSGFGLRTMGSNDGGYAPLSYHCGSVWPHDTAIAVNALCRNGHADLAGGLIDGLLAAGTHFDGRLPELYSGDPRGRYCRPVPYPAACHPQAWAAAAPVLLLQSLLGVMPDVPGGVLRLSPPRPGPAGRLRVQGLAVGNELVTIELDARGDVIAVTGTTLAVEVC
jgi:glycogen debranching enzyme